MFAKMITEKYNKNTVERRKYLNDYKCLQTNQISIWTNP